MFITRYGTVGDHIVDVDRKKKIIEHTKERARAKQTVSEEIKQFVRDDDKDKDNNTA